tara:strand:+ start:203 stop:1210 length:1008 start_codon:yes stop_codon:yes gene_type:complete
MKFYKLSSLIDSEGINTVNDYRTNKNTNINNLMNGGNKDLFKLKYLDEILSEIKATSINNKKYKSNIKYETLINKILNEAGGKRIELKDDQKKMLLDTIDKNQNNTISLISNKKLLTKEEEKEEGENMIKFIINNIIKPEKLFSDLKLIYYKGYIHIVRNETDIVDIITPLKIPNLKHLKWAYEIPIDYETLKTTLIDHPRIHTNTEIIKETKQILEQEYIIGLQPQYKNLSSIIEKLIKLMYSDSILSSEIRKIKILANQYRSDSNHKINKTYGTMPSILIIPNYGKKSATNIITQLIKYFDEDQGQKDSRPLYYTKVNNLIYYSIAGIEYLIK